MEEKIKKPQIGNLVNSEYGWKGVITSITSSNKKVFHRKKSTAVVEALDGLHVAWINVADLKLKEGEWYELRKPIKHIFL